MFNTKSIFELICLVYLNLKNTVYQFFDYLRVITKYYRCNYFFKIDSYLLSLYFFKNPFRISKNFLRKKGGLDIYVYGETPLATLEIIAKKCHLSSGDILFELGCGRGRSCFWLSHFIQCQTVGVDFVPEFIEKADRVKKKFKLKNVEFRAEDFLTTDFSGGTVFYLYAICLSDEMICQLIDRFKNLPEGVKIITISYALNEYIPNKKLFKILDSFKLSFPWGNAMVFIQERSMALNSQYTQLSSK